MPRKLNKADRLARIKTASSYPDTKTALAAIRAARDSQSLKRALDPDTVPVAVESPKHVSSRYARGKGRYISRVSEQADIWANELRRLLKAAQRVPVLVYRLSPRYYRVLANPGHRNIGPIMPEYSSSTHSRETVPATAITPALLAKAENILRAVPSDTLFPEQRASREWAQWILDTPHRIEAGKQLSHELAMTRQQSQRLGVRMAAENERNTPPRSPALPPANRYVITVPSDSLFTHATQRAAETRRQSGQGFHSTFWTDLLGPVAAVPDSTPVAIPCNQGWRFNRRVPLHTLVPLATQNS